MRISEACAVAGPSANAGHCSLELAPGKPWAAGRYRVELRIDDTVVAETNYRVQGARAAPPYSHPRNGYQIVPPPGWTTSDQVPTADVQMNSPDGDAVIEITSGPIADRLDPLSFAIGWESVSVGAGRRLQVKRAGRETRIDGEMAYEGVYEGDGVLVKVFFVGIPERFWVVIGVFRNDGFTHGEVTFDRMMSTLKMKR
ncbi:MAG: hypothetical protein HY655_05845 [Acidobacteria bacterium]|nr:hypothetical protein [Acidobacteriota bacterium]